MEVSLNWLNELVDLKDIDVKQIAHELTMSGLEVEEIEELRPKFTNIITDSDNIFLKENWEKYFIKNQTASIYVSSYNIPRTLIGCLGVVHPTINMQFKISLPISAFEIDLEKVFVLIKNII